MAPSFVPPRTTSRGEELPGWGVSCEYDVQADRLIVRWWKADTLRRRGRMKVRSFPVTDLEDAIRCYQVAVRTLGARRLL